MRDRTGPGRGSVRPARARPLFSTFGLQARDCLSAWQDHVARLNSATQLGAPPPGFAASSETWRVGPFLLTHNVTPRLRLTRGAQQRARDGLDHWSVRVAGKGEARVRAADRQFLVPAHQPTLSSFAIGFDSEYEAGEWIALIIPRSLDPVLTAAMARHGPGPLEGLPARMLGANLLSLARLIGEASEEDLLGLAEGLRGLLRGCLLGAARGADRMAEDAQHALLTERLRAVAAAQIGSALLDPGRLARQLGVSRSVLYRALQPEGGVARFVKGLRLEWVRAALADPARAGVPIAALAAEAGFFDASSFHRTFRASFGSTPRAWRAAALAGLMLPLAPRDADEGASDLLGLLRRGTG